jgi:UDP-N-acetyl-D-mannosaminuronate dehydrogenase
MDCVVVITDHSTVDYRQVAEHAHLVVDTRGVMRGAAGRARMVGLSGIPVAAPDPLPHSEVLV